MGERCRAEHEFGQCQLSCVLSAIAVYSVHGSDNKSTLRFL